MNKDQDAGDRRQVCLDLYALGRCAKHVSTAQNLWEHAEVDFIPLAGGVGRAVESGSHRSVEYPPYSVRQQGKIEC